MMWVTRERPQIDRIACPWLVARFIDSEAEFLYVPPDDVPVVVRSVGAIPFAVPGAELSRSGELSAFDAFLGKYELRDPALDCLAVIVRGAVDIRLDLAPESAGLLALSWGLSRSFLDDQELLLEGMTIYDALFAWCKSRLD